MATEAKARAVEEFAQVLDGASSVVLTDFTGLDVAAVSELRRRCRAAGVEYHVIKNTLAKRVIASSSLQSLESLLAGPNAWAIHKSDQVAAAKVVSEFAKDHANLKIRGGFVDGRLVSVNQLQVLAKLPGRDVLLAQVLAGMQAPMAGFAGVLTAVLRGFATAVDAYAKKRAESEPA
jgi:large subunit ribosomal protein L10